MSAVTHLSYLEWQALVILYRNRDRVSSPLRYVGLKVTIVALTDHKPPFARWVGNPMDNQVHITDEGAAFYQGIESPSETTQPDGGTSNQSL